jgi:hypothetical protein
MAAGDAFADAGVSQLFAHLPELVGGEQQHRLGQDDVDVIERVGDLVADVVDLRAALVAGGDGVDQRVVLMYVVAGRHLQGDDVVVERADVAQDFPELVHLPVVLRDQIENVGIERQPHRAAGCGQGDDDGEEDDGLAAPEAESGQRVEDSFCQSFNSRDDAGAGIAWRG